MTFTNFPHQILYNLHGDKMNRIKELRIEYELKQADLADALGVVRTAVSNYENEVNQLDAPTIRRLCEIFGVSADYLLGLSSRRSPEISPEDAELLAAYHAAPEQIRKIVDAALDDYRKKETTAAG